MLETKPLELTPYEIIADHIGKPIDGVQTYSSTTEFVVLFPNRYSIIIKENKRTTKYVTVEVFYNMDDVTSQYLSKKSKVKKGVAEAILTKISKLV